MCDMLRCIYYLYLLGGFHYMYAAKRGNRFLLFMLFTYLVGSLLISLYMSVTNKELSTISLIALSQWIIVFFPIVIYFLITKSPIKETILIRKIKWLNVLFCVLLAWAIMPILSFLNLLSQFFVKNEIGDVIAQVLDKPLWLILLLMAVTPALIEEIAMRSIIISNYRNKTVLTTCLISGFFFGMFHMNINQFIYAFVMGAIMCFVVHLTGSIFASMIIHFTINASNLIWAKFALWFTDFMSKVNPEYAQQITASTLDTQTLLLATGVVFAICLAFAPLIWLLLKALMKYNGKERILKDKLSTAQVLNLPTHDDLQQEKIVTPSFIASVVIFVLFTVGVEFIFPLL